MSKLRVGVARGGPSSEYEVSLQTGGSVLAHLPEHYDKQDILITRDGTWHLGGIVMPPERIARQVDVIFNALHGEWGEDGRIQSLLDELKVAYTGSGTFASALGMNKPLAKEIFRRQGFKVPFGLTLEYEAAAAPRLARQVFDRMAPPWVVKPADRGSSVGLSLARTYDELGPALGRAAAVSPKVLVEEYIRGREATCGVVDNFRGRPAYALPAIEIRRPAGRSVWSYEDKYSGATEELCPGNFSSDEKRALELLAVAAHNALGLRHYSRADFILSDARLPAGRQGIYLLEVNTLPGLTAESLLPKALHAVGCSYADFLDHLIKLALAK